MQALHVQSEDGQGEHCLLLRAGVAPADAFARLLLLWRLCVVCLLLLLLLSCVSSSRL